MAKIRIPQNYKEQDLKRARYNLSQNKITTLMQCLNRPMKFEIMKPKDEFFVDYRSMIESMPMVGKQYNDWKYRVMLFKSNLSNYYGWMDNNARDENGFEGLDHHTIDSTPLFYEGVPNYDNTFLGRLYGSSLSSVGTSVLISEELQYALQDLTSIIPGAHDETNPVRLFNTYDKTIDFGVQPNSMLDCLEFPVSFVGSEVAYSYHNRFNADYLLCYMDAVRNYLVNNQLDAVPYFAVLPTFNWDTNANTLTKTGERPYIGELPLSTLDNFFQCLRMLKNGDSLSGVIHTFEGKLDDYPYGLSWDDADKLREYFACLRFGGQFLAQFERDMLNNLLAKGDNQEIVVTTDENGNFSINQFRLRNRQQLVKDRKTVAGGRWKHLLRSIWGVDSDAKMDIPELINATSFYVSAKTIVSTANTESEDKETGSALGQLAGVFRSDDLNVERKPFKIYAEDHAIFFCIVSLVPEVMYCNGIGKGLEIVSFDDEYFPQYDGLGFQEVPRFKYNALLQVDPQTGAVNFPASANTYNKPVGKNVAFVDLISNVDRCHGDFTKDAYFETWVLKREYNQDFANIPGITAVNYPTPATAITSYANPMKFQYPFVVQSATDSNFVMQIAFDITANRSKGKAFMPSLGR